MSCSKCDRENAIKSYCYWSDRPIEFKIMTGREFTIVSFAEYAVEMELAWRILPCKFRSRAEIVLMWEVINKPLQEALRKLNSGEPFSNVKN